MTDTDDLSYPQPLDGSPFEHPDVLVWLAEARRLFTEAEERLEAGCILPALSSLTAVPRLHRMLIDRCASLLVTSDEAETPGKTDGRPGLYL